MIYYIIGPVRENMLLTDGTLLTAEIRKGRLHNCRINGRRVSAREYRRAREEWKKACRKNSAAPGI